MMGLFKKKQTYTTYEADDYYYENNYQSKSASSGKKSKKKDFDDYYFDEYGEMSAKRKVGLSAKIVLIVGVYIIFLVVGVFSTSFVKDEVGNKKAQIVNVEMREERESYNQLKNQYTILYKMVMDIQELDKEFATSINSGTDSSFVLSTKYQEILSRIDWQLPKVKALAIDMKYEPLRTQVTKVYTDSSYYLQKMAKALSEKDATTLHEAITWNQAMFADFSQFRLNMGEFAKIMKLNDQDVLENKTFMSIFTTTSTTSSTTTTTTPAATAAPATTSTTNN